MSFSFRPAIRENTSVLVSLAGGTGSGKTYSAMELGTGLAGGQKFAVIDTEAGRALHYADLFDFDHGELLPPFRPDAYAEAIAAADAAHYPVIVVDSFSHEHAGEGGLLDWHDEEYERLGAREQVKMTAWIAPKTAHRRMVGKLLQVRAHLILCLRAEEKVEIVKDPETGKTIVRPKQSLAGLDGWVPICEKTLPYEMTVSFLLHADRPGVPRPIKLPEQLRDIFPPTRQLSREAGVQLADWAQGSAGGPSAAHAAGDASPAPQGAASGAPASLTASGKAGSPADDEMRELRELLFELGVDTEPLRLETRKSDWVRSQIKRAKQELEARELAAWDEGR